VTLAPEQDEELAYTKFLTQRRIRVSAGHSNATVEEMEDAIDAGVTGITHLYNAMRPFHHREPGIVSVALNRDDLYTEIISDGVHVHPEAVRLALRNKPRERVILISDCLALAGLPEGSCLEFGQQRVTNRNGQAINEEGRLAGSTTFVNHCVKNLVFWELMTFPQAVQFATANPADYLGIGKEYGRILPGYYADVVLWDKNTLEVKITLINGEIIYQQQNLLPT
jgi:N-acetylglucosamine-6-phosphate deacetylase